MTKHERARIDPASAFEKAITEAAPLQRRAGLQAIKRGEGKGQISGREPTRILGSVVIDDDCRGEHPNAARWDYVIGYNRSGSAVAFFVEVHSAETSEVTKIADKLTWLKDFLEDGPQRSLAAFPREYHWVASGRINIPRHTPQFRMLNSTLRKQGLRGPVRSLELS